MDDKELKKIQEYQKILLKNPHSPLFAMLGECYRKIGRLEEALEVTRKGLEHKPDFVSGLVVHSRVLFDLQEYKLAIEGFKRSLVLRPRNLLSLRFLAFCHVKLGQHEQAVDYIQKLLKFNPGDKEALELAKQFKLMDSGSTNPEENEKNVDPPAENFKPFKISNPMRGETDFQKEKPGENNLNHSSNSPFIEDNSVLVKLQNRKEFYQRCLQRIIQNIDQSKIS